MALLAAAAALFAATPLSSQLGAIAGPLLGLALAVLLAFAASGGASAIAAAAGAAGAFASAVLSPASAAAGGAVLVAFAYAERTLRVRGRTERLVHLVGALVAGALAGTLAASYAGGAISLRAVAVIVSAVLVSLPQLVEADDLLASTLDRIAEQIAEPARASLREGAELRRVAGDALLDRATARVAHRTWQSLLRLAEARLRLEHARVAHARPARTDSAVSPTDAVISMVDARIAEHAAALARAYTAVDAARAAELGLDDAALRHAESVGETLEQVSRAIIDVQP